MGAAGNEIVPGVARVPTREDYMPIARALRPFLSDEEVELRASLLLMRDRAMATKNHACEPAWIILDVVERTASENAMNHRVSIDQLREIRKLCMSCVLAANGFDTLFQPRLPLGDGEANGRGV